MTRPKLSERLRGLFGRKSEPTEPSAETAEIADSAETDADEPQPMAQSLPDLEPQTPPADRMIESLTGALAAVDKAGEMLQLQAKRQQQFLDALADWPEAARQQAQQAQKLTESIRAESGHRDAEANLNSRLDELARQILTLLDQDRQLTDGQGKLIAHLDALDAGITGRLNDLTEALQRHAKASAQRARALKWIVLGGVILAAAACIAAVSAWLLG